MKLAELLFDRRMNVSGVKVWFGNNVLDISTLKEVWSFLNQELGTEDLKEEPKPVEKKKPGPNPLWTRGYRLWHIFS